MSRIFQSISTYLFSSHTFYVHSSPYIVLADNNHFTGTLPVDMRRLWLCQYLQLSFNEFTGTIPAEFETLGVIGLQDLILNDNLLTGPLPELNVLDKLYLSNNSFTGKIPESVWNLNITGLKLEDNNLFGAVSTEFCANLSFAEGFTDVYDLTVDDSSWFLDEPTVTCPCCDNVNCLMWDAEAPTVGGTVRPNCLPSSTYNLTVFERYLITDLITNSKKGEGVGVGATKESSFCISPTGCYEVRIEEEDGLDDGSLSYDKIYNLSYSASSRSLVEQESCDAVNICGAMIDSDHPRRMGLNHLTHLVVADFSIYDDPSSNAYKAMCWIMTDDALFDEYDSCDGTLLQRYIMAMFYFSQEDVLNLNDYLPKPTCDWDGVTCDPKGKFVEQIELQGRQLGGTLISEIGLLTRLKKLDLSSNNFVGSLDPVTFNYLPHMEIFHIKENKFENTVPKELVGLPVLKNLDISSNLFVGHLEYTSGYSEKLGKYLLL